MPARRVALDDTHDPARRSWVASANGHPDFPVQNLPYGVFRPKRGGYPRIGTAIVELVLDLALLERSGQLDIARYGGEPILQRESLNQFMSQSRPAWRADH